MHKRSIFLALFALLAIAAVVAGCGGGGSSSDTSGESGGSTEAESGGSTEESGGEEASGPAPTKAAFIKEADKICGDAEEELNKEITAYAKEKNLDIGKEEPSEKQQEELFQDLVLPNIAKQGEEIAALTPPEGDESTIEELTDTLSEEVEEAEEEGGVNENALAGATKQAKAYGFKTCGS